TRLVHGQPAVPQWAVRNAVRGRVEDGRHAGHDAGVARAELEALQVPNEVGREVGAALAGHDGAALQDGQGGRVGDLAQIQAADVVDFRGRLGGWHNGQAPNKGFTASLRAAAMSAELNTASTVSSNEQPYSWRNQRSPSACCSSAKNSGEMRGHCS